MTEPLEEVEDMLPTSKAADVASNAAAKIFAAAEEDGGGMGFGSPAAATPEAKSTTSKLLDFDLAAKTKGAAASPSTPITTPAPVMGQAPSRAEDKDSVDYVKFTKDTLLWTNTVRSAFYLVSGTVLLLTVDYMLGHNVPFLVVVAYLTLAQMALNFLRQAVSPSLQQKATWLDSAWTAAAISQLAGSIKTLAAIHDEHLSASNPHKHLIIASSLWMLSLLSKVISPMHLALVLYIGAFAIPKAYVTFKAKIDPVATKAWKQAKSKFDAADHRIKAGVIMVLILLLGCISTIDLLIACFVAFVFVHSQLPKEMEEIGKRVGPVVTPLGNTATKMGTKFSDMIIGASNKFELTPTPLKKKKEQ